MKLILLIVLASVPAILADPLNFCGDWAQYKDTKCIKVIKQKVNEEEAVKQCLSLDSNSTLVSIHSDDEQQFIVNLVKGYHNFSTSAWIGLTYGNDKFGWLDGSGASYTKWSSNAVIDGELKCVQMSLEIDDLGQWTDESCKKTALVICQKKQQLDLGVLRTAFMDMKNDYQAQIDNIRTSMIPMGFLYTQLGGQSDPTVLWPTMKWTDVTQTYAGLFFRAEGGKSGKFGDKQESGSPRITKVYKREKDKGRIDYDVANEQFAELIPGQESKYFFTGSYVVNTDDHGLSFYTSDDEVRPINMAVKIWKRTG